MADDLEFKQRMRRIEELIGKINAAADPAMRECAVELLQSLMELHGAGIQRMLDITLDRGEQGRTIVEDFSRDDLVTSLLLLYGLHPVEMESRIEQALEQLRPYVLSQGARAELLSLVDGVATVRIESNSNGCGSSSQTLKISVEEAVYAAAPDLEALEINETNGVVPGGFVPLKSLRMETSPLQAAPANRRESKT